MRIRITKDGTIYGKDGALPVGAELTVTSIPAGWLHAVEKVQDDPRPETVAVANKPKRGRPPKAD